MKYILFATLLVISCSRSSKKIDCSFTIKEPYAFLACGELFTKKPITLIIADIPDKKDWDFNRYFTGRGWSKNSDDAMKVLRADSCNLKNSFMEFQKSVELK